jgi:serine/threonine protein kinase
MLHSAVDSRCADGVVLTALYALLCCRPLRADFGLSTFIKPGQQLSEVCGTAYYMAPEVLLVGAQQFLLATL